MKNKLQNIFFNVVNNDTRSKKIAINIAKSLIVKIFSTFITLSLIPISLSYVEKESYGVWLTIASVITWFGIFDFGLSNGLTNRLTEAFANGNNKLANKYLSTTYFILLIITSLLGLIYISVSSLFNWNVIFSTKIDWQILSKTVDITLSSFAFVFILKPLTSLLMAKQKHFLANLIQVLGNLAALILIYFFGPFVNNNKFIFFSSVLAFSYPILLLIFTFILYSNQYKEFCPSWKDINISYSKDLFGLSIKFFIIQICVIVVLTGNNFFIAHFIDNTNVTYYNIAYRLYSIVSIFQLMFLQPLLSGFTHAYSSNDFLWIKNIVVKINRMNFMLCIILLLLFTFHKLIYNIWIGPEVLIPFEIDLLLFLYFLLYLFMQTYVSFINGIGKINLQAILSVITIILQFPLAYLLVKKANLGISGLISLNIFWVTVSLILWRKQYKEIMSGRVLNKLWQ